MASKHYLPLPYDEQQRGENAVYLPQPSKGRAWVGSLLSIALVLSLGLNMLMYVRPFDSSIDEGSVEQLSRYAKLAWDIPSVFNDSSRYNHPDREVEDEAWASELVRPSVFAVALEESYTDAMGLPRSSHWPWDKNKGVYVLNVGHELHCIHTIRTEMNSFYEGGSPVRPREHAMHCLEFLLRNVVCYADDSPLYNGYRDRSAGEGTPRMCRDWGKLIDWAKERSACYNADLTIDGVDTTEVDRYRFCPDDARPWEKTDV